MTHPMRQTEARNVVDAAAARLRPLHLRALFAADPGRPHQFALEAAGIHADFSRQRLDVEGLQALHAFARACDIDAARTAMRRGDRINATEGRAALHAVLRAPAAGNPLGFPASALHSVLAMRERMAEFCRRFEQGLVTGVTGRPLDTVVNIGIGGSDLGPRMACQALAPFIPADRSVHFVSNVDGHALDAVLAQCDPETTLFIIASKTFTTQETMTNAETARHWLVSGTGAADAAGLQCVALSTNLEAVQAFGIPEAHTFGFWEWVGGRYSVWSAIGLSLALGVGYERFAEMLAGAHAMDQHFFNAEVEQNLPLRMALVGVWNRDWLDLGTHAILPYDERLRRFPAFLQQLEMESGGKSVRVDGTPVAQKTSPVVWGEAGTDGQHAFYQYLHQGAEPAAIDILCALTPAESRAADPMTADRIEHVHHPILLANALAQAEALALGRTTSEALAAMRAEGIDEATAVRLAPHRTFPGNRPLTTLMFDRLDPRTLGALMAAYEHKVFCQSVLWGINAFDQFGVELGKSIAHRLEPALRNEVTPETVSTDPATRALLARVQRARH